MNPTTITTNAVADQGRVRLGGIVNPLPPIVADGGKVRLGGIAPIV